jgi:hypothetical protein
MRAKQEMRSVRKLLLRAATLQPLTNLDDQGNWGKSERRPGSSQQILQYLGRLTYRGDAYALEQSWEHLPIHRIVSQLGLKPAEALLGAN